MGAHISKQMMNLPGFLRVICLACLTNSMFYRLELMPAASPYQGSELSGAVQQPLQLGHHHHHQGTALQLQRVMKRKFTGQGWSKKAVAAGRNLVQVMPGSHLRLVEY